MYYLIAKADADNAVLETDETNNTTTRTIQIGGDLAVAALTVQVQGTGGPLVINDTTTNSGGSTVAPSVTRFYLSTDSILDASTVGGRCQPDGGVPGRNDDCGGGRRSVYYIIAKADADNVVSGHRRRTTPPSASW